MKRMIPTKLIEWVKKLFGTVQPGAKEGDVEIGGNLEVDGNVTADTATFTTWKYKTSIGGLIPVFTFDGSEFTTSYMINANGGVRCANLYCSGGLNGYSLTLGSTYFTETQLKQLLALLN